MMDLDLRDHLQLIVLLQNLPQLATEQERHLLLQDVGFQIVIPLYNPRSYVKRGKA